MEAGQGARDLPGGGRRVESWGSRSAERGRLVGEEGRSASMSFSLRGRSSGSIVSIVQSEQNMFSTTLLRMASRVWWESEISSKDRFLVTARAFLLARESTSVTSAGV